MITFVRGKLVQASFGFAVVETGGLGYKIFITASAYSSLPQIGSEIKLYTTYIVREISHTLYGFLSESERELFEEVINVSGIGPKTGLNLIGHLPMEQMQRAISKGDVAAISRVPGIGKKTAERLIIEMRDKFKQFSGSNFPGDFAIDVELDPDMQKMTDGISALVNLGYNLAVAKKAIQNTLKTLPEGADLSSLITAALSNV